MLRIKLRGVRPDVLQTFRLSHALMEAGIRLAVRRDQVAAYRWLDAYFPGLDWKAALAARPYYGAAVDHSLPCTAVGKSERPLVFAHAIADRCLEKWSTRSVTISFAGIMTDSRRETLHGLTKAFGDSFECIGTNAGRVWPSKAWDDEYYSGLGRSALTACPDGDFVWTYRFFEAAFCGSIPVIQNYCDHYEGFKFYRMTDSPSKMRWLPEWAERNAVVARERLTVPHDELRAAVSARGW